MSNIGVCIFIVLNLGWNSDTHVSTVQVKLVLKTGLSAYFTSAQLRTPKTAPKTNFICTVLRCVSEYQPYVFSGLGPVLPDWGVSTRNGALLELRGGCGGTFQLKHNTFKVLQLKVAIG